MSAVHETEREGGVYGVMAEFASPKTLLAAAKKAADAGYRKMDAYSPIPVEGLAEALRFPKTRIPLMVLIGGLVGGTGGYFLQYYAAVIGYPLLIAGRPLHSWPSFIPITFELTVLCAGLTAAFAMVFGNKLPEPYHPVFNVPAFQRASIDRFFLSIESADPQFDLQRTQGFLRSLNAIEVSIVEE